jgi:hypothetical protein
MLAGPGLFETMREQWDGDRAPAVPGQKAGCGSAEFTYRPKNIFHACPLLGSVIPISDISMGLDGLDAVNGVGVYWEG